MANLVLSPNLIEIQGNFTPLIPGLDQAVVSIESKLKNTVSLFSQGTECHFCEPYKFFDLEPNKTVQFLLKTYGSFGSYIKIGNSSDCRTYDSFNDKGEYKIRIEENSNGQEVCTMDVIKEPSNIYLPIIFAACFYLILAACFIIFNYLHRKLCSQTTKDKQPINFYLHNIDDEQRINSSDSQTKERISSLDVFRGLTMSICIFVINGAGGYYFFDHALWNGLYLSDFVFPWFMWIMGAGIAFSISSQLKKDISRLTIFTHIFRRAFLLFLFGVMFNTSYGHNDLKKLRVPGVLQRFSISYFFVASITLLVNDANNSSVKYWWQIASKPKGVVLYFVEWIIYASILATHIYLTFFYEIPGCPKGYIGPGGDHFGGRYRNCTGGVAGYIDNLVLGKTHIYQNPTFKILYNNGAFDPEGILGCLTTIFMVFTGVKCGKIMLSHKKPSTRCMWWFVWSLITGVAALVLCKASLNDGWIPINKNLWSVSFILSISSTAFILMIGLYYLIDVKKMWHGTPFLQPGKNSLLIYLGSSFLGQMFPWSWKTEDTHGMKTFIALWQTSLWVLISIYLHKKKIYFTL